MYVVRAYRGRIDLGIGGLFVPGDRGGNQTTGTTRRVTESLETPTDRETPENETPSNGTTTNGTTAAALQDGTTTPEETTTTTENGATTSNATVTPSDETATADGAETTATSDDGTALPEIRVGEWYEVASSTRCDGLFRLTLTSIEQPETTPG